MSDEASTGEDLIQRDHRLRVPLDHDDPDGEQIDIFAREVVAAARRHDDLPWLLFLQGGPGGQSPRPVGANPGWITAATRTHRVLLLDQRGCGLSSPVTPTRAAGVPVDALTDAQLADRLSHFRGDSIVRDCELLRRRLIGDGRWELLAQSYGGWVTLSYLSMAPEALDACYVTGGLPGLQASAEEVYRRTFPRVAEKNARFAERYPEDLQTLARVADRLAEGGHRLPDGDPFTVRRLRRIGAPFGMGDGFEEVHWLLEQAFDGDDLSDRFCYQVMNATTTNPIYALQEWICYGAPGMPTAWAAERVQAELPEFSDDARPLLLTGEMMHPWMFEEIRALRGYAGAADLLAARDDWPALWDVDRLRVNEVPVNAAVYVNDMYVDADLSRRTAQQVGNVRTWETADLEHDGVRADATLLPRLMALRAI